MIKIQNIYHMLAYAFNYLREHGREKLDCEEFKNTADLLSALLSHGVALQIKRGLGKEYISCSDSLSTLRGKIDISQSIKEQSLLRKKMHCHFDEFTINSKLNQIIKVCIGLLLRNKCDIAKERKQALKKLLPYFVEVDDIEIKDINWNIRFNRNNLGYQMIIGVCYLMVHGLLQKDEQGCIKIQKFLDMQTMARLYEKFIFKYYERHKKDYANQNIFFDVTSPQIKWDASGDIGLLPVMQTDVVLTKKGGGSLIIDAKYYAKSLQKRAYSRSMNDDMGEVSYKQTIHSHNLYQIFSYVKNAQVKMQKPVCGMLLYAKTDDEANPNCEYELSGNKILVKNLDLNQDFESIKSQLDKIVFDWYYD